MAETTIDLQRFDNVAISQLFSSYVSCMEDKLRHTAKADMEVGIFDQFRAGAFPHNVRLQNGLYDKMMNVAVEYEKSGFISGFRYAMTLLSSQEQILTEASQIPTLGGDARQHETINASQKEIKQDDIFGSDCITTKQIADMFETTNFKVVSRIERQILPYLDHESKKFFCKVEEHNVQHKPITMYKLNKTACQLYLKEMETKKKNFINIAGGYAKLQELMEVVFPSDMRVAIA